MKYKDIVALGTYEERVGLLQKVAKDVWSEERWVTSKIYNSKTWRSIRSKIIVRDNGCDIALPNRKISGKPYIHHIMPVSKYDSDLFFDEENLILVSNATHTMIHYQQPISDNLYVPRTKGDTTLWKTLY